MLRPAMYMDDCIVKLTDYVSKAVGSGDHFTLVGKRLITIKCGVDDCITMDVDGELWLCPRGHKDYQTHIRWLMEWMADHAGVKGGQYKTMVITIPIQDAVKFELTGFITKEI